MAMATAALTEFQLTAARRRLRRGAVARTLGGASFNSQPLEGGCYGGIEAVYGGIVSTHSRSKAAAPRGCATRL